MGFIVYNSQFEFVYNMQRGYQAIALNSVMPYSIYNG